jgi:dipeptidyl aminopeptidase/acylaminoacyl peptidase
MSRIIKLIIEVIISALMIVIFVSFYAYYTYTRPSKIGMTRTPGELGANYENVWLQTSDGLSLSAWFVPRNNLEEKSPAIIICHGYPGNKDDVLDWGYFLHPDYHLLYFDFRAHGESRGSTVSFGANEIKDLIAAVNYLTNSNDVEQNNIGVMGFSMGGVVGLLGAQENMAIKAVVADSPYADLNTMIKEVYQNYSIFRTPFIELTKLWAQVLAGVNTDQVSAVEAVKNMDTPLMLIHVINDDQIPQENSQRIYDAAHEPKYLWIVAGDGHGQAYWLEQEEYQRRVRDFFAQYLWNRE